MATKKQKREAALSKHEELMEELRITGLKAQERDRQRRAAQKERAEQERKQRASKLKETETLFDAMEALVKASKEKVTS